MDTPFDLPETTVAEVRQGDLIFCTKASPMQRLLTAVGDPWRHVAMALDIDGELCIGEVSGAHKIVARPLEKALEFYDLVASARVDRTSDNCTASAAEWVREYIGSDQLYAWDDVLLVGLLLATRRSLPPAQIDRLAAAMEEVAQRAPKAEHPSMTCSSFIFEAFSQTGEACRLSVPISPMDAGPTATAKTWLPTSLTNALSLDEPELTKVLESASILELLADDEGCDDDSGGSDLDGSDFELAIDPELGVPFPMAGPVGHQKSKTSPAQLARFARIVVDMVTQYGRHYVGAGQQSIEAPAANGGQAAYGDGRWVSPGDLWRSSDLANRAYLKSGR